MKTNIKKYISVWTLIFSAILIFSSCEEKPWSEDYDIEWPVTTISSVTPLTGVPGDIVTITGTNMEHATSVYIGASVCTPIAGTQTPTQLQITVPETVGTGGEVSVLNVYRRRYVYTGGRFTPSN